MASSETPEPGPFPIAVRLATFRMAHRELGEDFDILADQIKALEVKVDDLRRFLMIPSDQW